jgi:hypothetical protein
LATDAILSVSTPQLTYGLSTEYTNKPSEKEGKAEKVDADRDLFAKYYVNQIMSMDESGIKDAWHKVRGRKLNLISAAYSHWVTVSSFV